METIGAEAAKLAGLQVDMMQKILNGQITLEQWEWFNNLSKRKRDHLCGISIIDERFKLTNTFKLTVPERYDHDTQLKSFSEENYRKFCYYDNRITDKNFAKITNKLVPGKTYTAKVFQITERVSSEDCMAFLKTQKAILVGAQGISLVWQEKKEEFSAGKYTVSFDEKDVLYMVSDGHHRVPFVRRASDGVWQFSLCPFEYDWNSGFCLLCLCDESTAV